MNLYTLIPATIFLALSLLLLPLLNNYWLSLTPSTPSVADLILRNGVIFTSDESLPFADSMAILNGRILRVGNYSSIQELAGDGTKELNLEGKFVVPGFIDSHVHLIWGGLQV
ncbi:hypothetical protein Patl1_05359 [Pistacia atlantica]|uniref:Uncharacterized protein n=1 Tax=Pistacia atlantica TaxID=434234 RepID=A0ACC1BPU8_9ROSI|nr:hypothetical protein Patl1_05359 [Pistacia atlantica]